MLMTPPPHTYLSTQRIIHNPFFWVVHSTADDPISQNARSGKINIEHDLFKLFKVPGVFLDLGSNIGAFSLPFAAMGWRGYAFEASSQNCNILKKSIHLNDFDITVVNKAIYDKTGNIYFGAGKGGCEFWSNGLIKNEVREDVQWEKVPCISLDDWIKQDKKKIPEKITFIKMDIEGSEVAALRGMKKMLKKNGYPPIFVESNSWTLFLQNETQKSLLNTANEMGYIPYILKEDTLLEYNINNFPTILVTDFLLLKDIPKSLKKKSKVKSFEASIQDSNEVVSFLIQNLSIDSPKHILMSYCYVLKDFPDYASNLQIKERLEIIAGVNSQDKFLEKYLGWYV